jgi:hypothetical protein
VRVSSCTGEQIFLSGSSAFHGERSVAGRDDGEKNTAAPITHSLFEYESL